MSSELQGVYGCGWAFPVTFTGKDGGYMVWDGEDIAQSLQILFSTQPLERVMRPDFGCDLEEFLFESISEALLAQLRARITDSVLRYEPRVTIEEIAIEQDTGQPWRLHVRLAYRIRGTNALRHLSTELDLEHGRRGFYR